MQNFFLNMNIGARLSWGFGAILSLIIAFGIFALYQIASIGNQSKILYHHPFAVTQAVDAVEISTLKIHREMKDLAHEVNSEQIQLHQSKVAEFEADAFRHLEIVRSRFLGNSKNAEEIYQSLIDWRPIRNEVVRLRIAGELNAADVITRREGASHIAHIESELEKLKLFAASTASDSIDQVEAIDRQSRLIVGLVLAIALLLSVGIAVLITRSIHNPLKRLDRVVAKVRQGDLEQHVTIISQDELGRLSAAFNSMLTSIRDQTKEIQRKNAENERLLLNILPRPIADRLKSGEETIADYFPEVTVLFADIVGFTSMSESAAPDDIVKLLNELFTAFDDAARRLNIEKIKTIGDSYMAVAGLTKNVNKPAVTMVEMALEMNRAVDRINSVHGTSFKIRIGINCGPVVAGVIGKSKFAYDLWGETVNLASRMESHGVAGRIQLSEALYERVKSHFKIEPRGKIDIRGKGLLAAYLV